MTNDILAIINFFFFLLEEEGIVSFLYQTQSEGKGYLCIIRGNVVVIYKKITRLSL